MKTSRSRTIPRPSSITFLDNNLGGGATVRTDAVIDGLLFVFKDVDHARRPTRPNVIYVETQVTIRTRTINPSPCCRKPAC